MIIRQLLFALSARFLVGLRKEREGSNEQDGVQQGNHRYCQKRQVRALSGSLATKIRV